MVLIAPFRNPDDDELQSLLTSVKTIAVVGYSTSMSRPSHSIAHALRQLGFRIIPVRPGLGEALGEKAYPDVLSIPEPVDLVDVFRNGRHAPEIVSQCLARGVRSLWMQEGCINPQAAAAARAAGMIVVMDRCILRDYMRLVR